MKRVSSLRSRMVASYALLAFLLLGVAGMLFSAALVDYARRTEERRVMDLVAQAELVAKASKGSPEEIERNLQELFPELEIIKGPDAISSVLVNVGALPDRSHPPGEVQLFPDFDTFTTAATTRIVTIGTPLTIILLKATPGPVPLARVLFPQVTLVVLTGIGLATLIGWWFSRQLARPLTELTHALQAVASGDFPQPMGLTGTSELDRLVAQFNVMVARLNDSFSSLARERDTARRFAADAAHELKTPLTALRAYHEIVESRPERAPQLLPAAGQQVERIERITDGLLKLARISEGTEIALSRGDLRETVRTLLRALRLTAGEYDHTLRFAECPDPLPVRLDQRLVELILSNLVENACKFTPPEGGVRLSLAAEDGMAVIRVEDDGPGIPAQELPHIFERFHRGLETQEIPGSGLGLSIVREAADRLGGKVEVWSEVGVGSRFSVRIPLISG